MDTYSLGFEENHNLRSDFIRDLTVQQMDVSSTPCADGMFEVPSIPKTLIRYWHDPGNLPNDVRACLDSWNRLGEEGFNLLTFNDALAAEYIARRYSTREREAFARCRHPAMRSDYLRMCAVLAEGGFYVDADDVLLGEGWGMIFRDCRLKVQPLCYDIPTRRMLSAAEIWQKDLPRDGRIFYVNNNPIAAPPSHPIIRRALARATEKLLGDSSQPEIQATTGPGNLTACLAAHARDLNVAGAPVDFEFLRDWGSIAETRWELSYRNDARNWRNMDAT